MRTSIRAVVGSICVVTFVAAWRTSPVVRAIPQTSACWTLSEGDLDLTARDTRTIVSATDSVAVDLREENGIPSAHADSVRLYPSDPACDSAAHVYDSVRAARGDTTGHYPIALYRIFGTKVYIGTVLERIGGYREYVVFDSTFSVKGKLHMGS